VNAWTEATISCFTLLAGPVGRRDPQAPEYEDVLALVPLLVRGHPRMADNAPAVWTLLARFAEMVGLELDDSYAEMDRRLRAFYARHEAPQDLLRVVEWRAAGDTGRRARFTARVASPLVQRLIALLPQLGWMPRVADIDVLAVQHALTLWVQFREGAVVLLEPADAQPSLSSGPA
jgi:hypothetical protein